MRTACIALMLIMFVSGKVYYALAGSVACGPCFVPGYAKPCAKDLNEFPDGDPGECVRQPGSDNCSDTQAGAGCAGGVYQECWKKARCEDAHENTWSECNKDHFESAVAQVRYYVWTCPESYEANENSCACVQYLFPAFSKPITISVIGEGMDECEEDEEEWCNDG